MCVWQLEAKSQPMHGTVTLITQMWGWAGVQGLHGQALLYTALRKPLWVLGPHFKCLFILALITRSNPAADPVVCVCKGLECKAEVALWKPVSLTKRLPAFELSEAPQPSRWSPRGRTTPRPDLCGLFYLTILSNMITIMHIRVLFVADCCSVL